MAAYSLTSVGNTTKGIVKNEFITANATVTRPPLSNVLTTQSSQHKGKCKELC